MVEDQHPGPQSGYSTYAQQDTDEPVTSGACGSFRSTFKCLDKQLPVRDRPHRVKGADKQVSELEDLRRYRKTKENEELEEMDRDRRELKELMKQWR